MIRLLKRLNLSLLLFFILILQCYQMQAEEKLEFSIKNENSNALYSFGIESSFIRVPETSSSLTGLGPNLSAEFNIKNNFSARPSVAFVLNSSGKIQYTGFSGYARYSFSGELIKKQQSLMLNNKEIVSQKSVASNRFTGGLGLEQILLNGSQSVYSASGLGAELGYNFYFIDRFLEITARYSILRANNQNLNAFFMNISMGF